MPTFKGGGREGRSNKRDQGEDSWEIGSNPESIVSLEPGEDSMQKMRERLTLTNAAEN